MEENQTLRSLLRGVSGFIGEGAGGLLPKLGWDQADFTNFVNRSETDTAWESYQLRKKAAASAASSSSLKRSAEDDANGHAKRARGTEKDDSYSMLLPLNQVVPSAPVTSLYPGGTRGSHENNGGIFSDLMRGPGSPLFMQTTTSASAPSSSATSYAPNSFPSSFASMQQHLAPDASMPPPAFPGNTNGSASAIAESPPDQVPDDEDPKKNEALKLIQYVFYEISDQLTLMSPLVITWTIIKGTHHIACLHRFGLP